MRWPIAQGETDQLLAQASVAGKLLSFLKTLNTSESKILAEELFGLIVNLNQTEEKGR